MMNSNKKAFTATSYGGGVDQVPEENVVKAKLAASQLATKSRGGGDYRRRVSFGRKAESTDVDEGHSNKRNQSMGGRCTLHHNAAAYVVERGTAVCLL